VAGYNIYRAATAAGPFSKINTGLVTATVYVDAGIAVGIAAGGGGSGDSSYYVVTSVDSGGTESVQSLAVKPPSAASGSSGGGGGGGGAAPACFIESVRQSIPQQSICFFVLLIVGVAVCYWRQASGIRRQRSEGRRQMSGVRGQNTEDKKPAASEHRQLAQSLNR
jgi:hypothetical protein